MDVLMIGMDETIARTGPGIVGDTRARHLKYAEALQKREPGSRLVVITRASVTYSPEPIEEGGLIVYPVPCLRLMFLPRVLRKGLTLSRRYEFDLITTQTPFDDGLTGLLLSRRRDIPLNVQMRSSFLDDAYWIAGKPIVYRIFNWLGKRVSRRAKTVRVISRGEKQRLEKRFPWLRSKIHLLQPLVNKEMFAARPKERELEVVKRTLLGRGLPSDKLVLFVGRLSVEKDIPTLLRAFGIVLSEMPGASLAIVGDGGLRRSLENLSLDLDIDKRIIWTGAIPSEELRGWFLNASVTALPSLHEGFGKVIAESYLMGTPTVVTPFVSANELVLKDETGLIVPFKDPSSLAKAIIDILSNPDTARAMGERGKAHILGYLPSDEEYMDRLVRLWRATAYAPTSTEPVDEIVHR